MVPARALGVLVFGFALLCLSLPTRAQPPITAQQIAEAIKQLGDGRFAVREKASALLKAAGRAAEPALREALSSGDAEVVRRAQAILDEYKWGVYPDTPKPITDLVHLYQGGDEAARRKAVHGLIALSKPGYAAVRQLVVAEDDPVQRPLLLAILEEEVAHNVLESLIADDLDAAEALLELGMLTEHPTAIPNYAILLAQRGKLDERIRQYQTQATKPGAAKMAEVLAYLYRTKGDLKQARAAAARTGKAELLESLSFELRDWKTLAGQTPPANDGDLAWVHGLKAFCLSRAGLRDAAEKALAEVRQAAAADHWSAAEALFANERPDEAIALLLHHDGHVRAFELLALRMRFREALALSAKAKEADGDDPVRLAVLKARTRWRLGDREQAVKAFRQIASQVTGDLAPTLLPLLIETEAKLGLKDLAREHEARYLTLPHKDAPAVLFAAGFEKQAATAAVWWPYLRQRSPNETPVATLRRLHDLLEGKLPEGDVTRLFADAEQAAGKQAPGQQATWCLTLAETALAVGRDDLALTHLQKWVEKSNTLAAHLRIADYYARKKQWKEAAGHYGSAWELDRRQAGTLYLRGWAQAQAGQELGGRKLMDVARRLPLAEGETRLKLAEALREHGLLDEARQELETVLRQEGLLSEFAPPALNRLAADALRRKDYLMAADCYEQLLFRCLRVRWGFASTEGYLLAPLFMHQYRARGLLATGRPLDEVRAEIRHCQTAVPGDANLPLLLVPLLDLRGHKKDADELFDPVYARHAQLCTEFPRSDFLHNETAWLAACCHRRLDEALAHARTAVELAPDTAGHLDTLAEVHFQRGEKDEALKWIKKAAALDPKRAYFRKQLERMKAGDARAELPTE